MTEAPRREASDISWNAELVSNVKVASKYFPVNLVSGDRAAEMFETVVNPRLRHQYHYYCLIHQTRL